MADREALLIPNPSPSVPSLCDECRSNPWKYRCPGCSLKSCSLPCVKSHKARTNCSGKRNRTEFVPLFQFDDKLLISDYNLLEETKRAAESARRMAGAIDGFRGYIGFRLPKSLLMLRGAANRRGTKLLLLPPGMSKRQTNQSRYDSRKNSIFWTIEWRFHATDVVLVDHGVDEHVSLFSVIEKHLAPSPLKNQLSPYHRNVKVDDLKFFLRKTPKGLKSPFRELNVKAPIGRQLADVVILEYPVVFVFLPSHSYEFEVEKDVRLSTKKAEPAGSFDRKLSPKDNLFMEEEIEEGEVFSGTLVTDLMGHMNSVSSASIQQGYPVAEKAIHVSDVRISREDGLKPNSSQKCRASIMQEAKRNCISTPTLQDCDMQISRTITDSSKPFSSQKPQASMVEKAETYSTSPLNSLKPSVDANFDFQQELRDAYSELIGEINPDDFLCLDGGYNDLDNLDMFWGEEELEEGEIPRH